MQPQSGNPTICISSWRPCRTRRTRWPPIISAETLQFHHGKHHRKYVETANQLLEKESVDARSLEELCKGKRQAVNNAAQVWNHDFYWHSLSPRAANRPRRCATN